VAEGHESAATEPLSIDVVRSQIVGIDQRIPLLDGSERTYINLDNAASTPALRPVLQRVNDFLPWYSSVHRGTGFKSQISSWAYEQARETTLRFLGAEPGEHVVIFGRHTTDAINKLAHRFHFGRGDVVLLSAMEHHSNDLPWRGRGETHRIHVTAEGALDEDHLDHLLRRFAGRVRLLVISGASNVTGYANPIYRLARKVHEVGGQIMVDAAQLAPHRKVVMGPLNDPAHIDYLALSGHKMYAPYGTGVLVGRRDTFTEGDPELVGGGAISLVTRDSVVWAPLPEKEEAGSPNVVGAVALGEALRCLDEIGMDTIAAHEADLTAHALTRLQKIDRLVIYGDKKPECCPGRVGVISLAIPGLDDHLVAAILNYEAGVGVRNGCFCAQPYLFELLGLGHEQISEIKAAVARGEQWRLPGLVRLSFGCYNTIEEVDAAADALEQIARGEYRGRYMRGPDGRYQPEGYQVDWSQYFYRAQHR
jgi:selenocysteine lyase/cysteine desulfurase